MPATPDGASVQSESGDYVLTLTCVGGWRCKRTTAVRRREQAECRICVRGWKFADTEERVILEGPPQRSQTPVTAQVSEGPRGYNDRLSVQDCVALDQDFLDEVSVHTISKRYRLRLKTVFRKRAAFRTRLGLT